MGHRIEIERELSNIFSRILAKIIFLSIIKLHGSTKSHAEFALEY